MLAAGEQIGSWVVIRPLGSGGMGSVFLCHDHRSERLLAAVKVFHSRTPDQQARFLREVEALNRLRHPTIVRTLGWGEADGRLFLAMEYIEGRELAQVILDGPMPPVRALRLFAQLADGLAHAHQSGITHRDLKPANILITPEGEGRLVDFGIAADEAQSRLTEVNVVAGSIAYLPLEVMRPDPPPVLPLIDVFALTQCLAETLLGQVTFPAEGLTRDQHFLQVIQARKNIDGIDIGDGFAPGIRDLIRTCTATDPTRRLSMIQLRDRLSSLVVSALGQSLTEDDEAETRWVAFDVPRAPAPRKLGSPSAPEPRPVQPPGVRPPEATPGGTRPPASLWLIGLLAGGIALGAAALGGGGVYLIASSLLSRSAPLPGPVPSVPLEPPPSPPKDTGLPATVSGVPEEPVVPEAVEPIPPPTEATRRPPPPKPEVVSPPPPEEPLQAEIGGMTQQLCLFYPGTGEAAELSVQSSAGGGTVLRVTLSPGSYTCKLVDAGTYAVSGKARRSRASTSVALRAGGTAHVQVAYDPDESKADRLRLEKATTSQGNLAGLSKR